MSTFGGFRYPATPKRTAARSGRPEAQAAWMAGKLAAGFAAGRGTNAWVVGWGMVPRGEVGLIFAVAGQKLGVLSESMFSIIVIMVILTTLVTPPVLTFLLKQQAK